MVYFVLFIFTCAGCEAMLYNLMNPNIKNPINEHIILNTLRLVVFLGIFKSESWEMQAHYLITCVCLFPFIHDTTYYLTRHLLDTKQYPNWYWTTSTTSTAISDRLLNATGRLLLFIFGLCYWGTDVTWIIVVGFFIIAILNSIRNMVRIGKMQWVKKIDGGWVIIAILFSIAMYHVYNWLY